jgi:hypothetical protein
MIIATTGTNLRTITNNKLKQKKEKMKVDQLKENKRKNAEFVEGL